MNTNLHLRPCQTEDDYWQIRRFLREVYLLNHRLEYSWQVYRFDYWRWHGIENIGQGPLIGNVFLWETAQGSLGAVLNAEDPGHAHLQIHPAFDTPALRQDMIETAEQRLAREKDGQRRLTVWVNRQQGEFMQMLTGRGYHKADGWSEHQRRRPLTGAIPDKRLPEGFIVRPLGDITDLPARGWASWRGFHENEPPEGYGGWSWLLNVQRCPLYRRDLDLVCIAPGGEVGAFCTVWFDDMTRTGAFEPVATSADYRRLGLASAVMTEGMRRVQRLGANLATVGSYTPHAHALYASMGFTDEMISEPWVRYW